MPSRAYILALYKSNKKNNADTDNNKKYGRRQISSSVSVVTLNEQQETKQILNPDGYISKQLHSLATSENFDQPRLTIDHLSNISFYHILGKLFSEYYY